MISSNAFILRQNKRAAAVEKKASEEIGLK
jgi:hypothetical protein